MGSIGPAWDLGQPFEVLVPHLMQVGIPPALDSQDHAAACGCAAKGVPRGAIVDHGTFARAGARDPGLKVKPWGEPYELTVMYGTELAWCKYYRRPISMPKSPHT